MTQNFNEKLIQTLQDKGYCLTKSNRVELLGLELSKEILLLGVTKASDVLAKQLNLISSIEKEMAKAELSAILSMFKDQIINFVAIAKKYRYVNYVVSSFFKEHKLSSGRNIKRLKIAKSVVLNDALITAYVLEVYRFKRNKPWLTEKDNRILLKMAKDREEDKAFADYINANTYCVTEEYIEKTISKFRKKAYPRDGLETESFSVITPHSKEEVLKEMPPKIKPTKLPYETKHVEEELMPEQNLPDEYIDKKVTDIAKKEKEEPVINNPPKMSNLTRITLALDLLAAENEFLRKQLEAYKKLIGV